MKFNPALMKRRFNHLRKESRYSELGWCFWGWFLQPDCDEKKEAKKLWASLTPEEKEMCEKC